MNDLRLAEPYGSRIDRSRCIEFRFAGERYAGFLGDTIASALMANGRFVLSRSFKYHRPRGVLTMAGQDANSLVQVGAEPNVLADRRRIEPGLEADGQNYRGTLDRDRDAFLDRLARFLPVGFYYRAFWGPRKSTFVKVWEPMIRRKAGIGKISLEAPNVEYDKINRFCDVLVVGGGPAGMSAALAAGQLGAEVLLVEEEPELGGSLTYRRGDSLSEFRRSLVEAIEANSNITVMADALANGWYADNWVPVIQGVQLHKVRARSVVIAAGWLEQPVVFRNNDLPGIMLGSAAQRLIRHYGVKPGRRAVVLTCNSQGYDVARDLEDAGVAVAAIVDSRAEGHESAPVGMRVVHGSGISAAEGVRRSRHVRLVKVSPIAGNAYADGGEWLDCDLVCVCGGYVPTFQLPLQAGARLDYDDAGKRFSIKDVPDRFLLCGAVNGTTSLDQTIADGRRAGCLAAEAIGIAAASGAEERGEGCLPTIFDWPIAPHRKGKDFIDFDEDLQVCDIENTLAEGYCELELVKRFATAGMGPSQGRHAALSVSRIVADKTGRSIASIGVTTARPPFAAENLGVLAGRHVAQYRRTPMHFRHIEASAVMQPVGAWWRPSYYRTSPDRQVSIEAEVKAVREGVGMLDVSTLGGLEVRGRDAAELLNRLYTLRYDTLPIGRTRYLLLTNEMGSVIDDGVAFRMAEDHFYVTSTTGAVGAVYQLMLFMNAEWRLHVDVANATAVFAGVNVTGPASRRLLAGLSDDIDFSAAGFPYLHGSCGTVCGQPARVMRIGFTGELSFEVHVPYSRGEALWDRLIEAGEPLGLRPYGLEASRILRLEKGHVIVGQDTDAMTTPEEIGMQWAVSKKKPYFLGKRSLEQRHRRGLQRRLVGFQSDDRAAVIGESCLVLAGSDPVGFVTSTCWSPTLNRQIGLAYTSADIGVGGTIVIRDRRGRNIGVPVVSPHFYDPDGKRQEL